MKKYPQLYIPGPVNVSRETLDAMGGGMMPHRSEDFRVLYAEAQEGLREVLGTGRSVYLMTVPSSGVMEAVLRNLCGKKVLSCCCGAFSERWHEMAPACGKEADVLQVPWREVITPDLLREALSTGGYDLVTLVHSETSTGVLNPLLELAEVVKEFPDVLLAVDMVSSFSAVPVEMDAWGIDVILAGVQKALALPPGMTVACVSERALERAKGIEGRGYFLDFIEWEKNASANMTVATPSISHLHALVGKVREIRSEGLDSRYQRHLDMRDTAVRWAEEMGIEPAAPFGYRTPALTCFMNNKGWDLPVVIGELSRRHGLLIDGGYGQLKGKAFRVAHMGNETPESLTHVLRCLSEVVQGE